MFCFFFFKQKTAYEMRISDWSSDVCDLGGRGQRAAGDDALDEAVEIDLLDMHLAAVDRIDDLVADVDAGDAAARACDQRGGGQADIAEAEDGDLLVGVNGHAQRPTRTSVG